MIQSETTPEERIEEIKNLLNAVTQLQKGLSELGCASTFGATYNNVEGGSQFHGMTTGDPPMKVFLTQALATCVLDNAMKNALEGPR